MSDERLSLYDFSDYLLHIGGDLGACGCPSYRLEEVIRVLAAREGYSAQAFAMPTGLFISLTDGKIPTPIVRMTRVKDWGIDLERMAIVDEIFNDVLQRKCSISEARHRLHGVEDRPPLYPRGVKWLATSVSSAATAVFFRGHLLEMAIAALAGAIVGVVGSLLRRNAPGRFLSEFLGATVAALCAALASWIWPDLSREVVILSAIITLIPGLTLTTGLSELALKNLVAGGARLMEAFAGFLLILFGIALVVGLEQLLHVHLKPPVLREGLALPFQAMALVAAALGFTVRYSVPRSSMMAALGSAAVGWITTALGIRYLPGHIAAFGAALAICLMANGFARITQRPAQIFQLPGMMILVPGSFGFLSLEAFLRGEFLGGAVKAFEMVLIAGAMVTGILLANLLLPAKKIL